MMIIVLVLDIQPKQITMILTQEGARWQDVPGTKGRTAKVNNIAEMLSSHATRPKFIVEFTL